ncbi:MAG: trypsin-like peptidase domain-containing protein [Cyanobacteria bacterium J06638_22]
MILNQLETELAAVSQHLRSITVEIANYRSGGSGVIWSADGFIVTNSHVVGGPKVQVRLATGDVVAGAVVARDRHQDLALLKVNAKNLPTPAIGNAEALRPGELVLAMGNPWGFSGALTAGIIHSQGGQEVINAVLDGVRPMAFSQSPPGSMVVADIRLAPGNSGGVLANARGEVVGINTAIFQGLALAIPSQQVTTFVRTMTR